MPCNTCDHTMQNLGVENPAEPDCDAVFWCPRCGTIKAHKRGIPDDASFLLSVPFWMKKQPHIELVVCNDQIHEVPHNSAAAREQFMREYMQDRIEAEVQKRLRAAVELEIRRRQMSV